MKDEQYLIDSNILVYSFDASEPDKQKICASLIRKCWVREVSYAISLQNLSEFYVTVTRKIEYLYQLILQKKSYQIFQILIPGKSSGLMIKR